MKKIEAIIRRTRFDDVKEALLAADIEWFSYYEVRGVGKTREARIYRGVAYDTSSIHRRDRRRTNIHHSGRGRHTDTHGRAGRHSALQR